MRHTLLILFLTTILALPATAATPTAEQLVDGWRRHKATSFTGKRAQDLARGDMKLHLKGQVTYRDPGNFQIRIVEPSSMSAMQLALRDGKSQFFFPEERLHFDNDNPAAREYAESILSHLTDRPDLLQKNYSLMVMGTDITALTPTYILDAAPFNGYRTPGRRFWLSRDEYQILREERRWAANLDPYFTSYYSDFQVTPGATLNLPEAKDWRQMTLRAGTTNFFRWFPSMAEMQSAMNTRVPTPAFIPPGFELTDVSRGTFYGATMTTVRYTDGLNNFWVMSRPKTNVFVGLIAGQYAIGLMKKFQEIVYHLPYNYYMYETGDQWVYAYGDLYPSDLEAVAKSLPQPTSSPS